MAFDESEIRIIKRTIPLILVFVLIITSNVDHDQLFASIRLISSSSLSLIKGLIK